MLLPVVQAFVSFRASRIARLIQIRLFESQSVLVPSIHHPPSSNLSAEASAFAPAFGHLWCREAALFLMQFPRCSPFHP